MVWPMSTVVQPPPAPAVNRDDYGGARLLISDLWTAWMLLAEGDYRALARVFGIRRNQTTMVTVIGTVMLAHAARQSASKALQGVGRPSLGDAALGSGAVKEGLHMIAGPASRDVPLGSLIALVVLAKLSRPAIRRSTHAMESGSRLMHEMFIGRYGHLVGHHGNGHRRPRISRHPLKPQRSG